MPKKALLIGINYVGTSSQLRGCINDVLNVKNFLIQEQGFKEEEIRLMTEASDKAENIPIKSNIVAAIKELVKDNGPGSKLVLHYSGHGSWTYDRNNDEEDRRDESICPLDFRRSGDIIDDELRVLLVEPLNEGAELFCLFDSCHSGTVLDLKYTYKVETKEESTTYTINADKNYLPSRGQVLTVSGCQDQDTSSDSYTEGKFQGAMTFSFLRAYEQLKKAGKIITYKNLMKNLLIVCKQGGFEQIPQLCSGKFMDLGQEFKMI